MTNVILDNYLLMATQGAFSQTLCAIDYMSAFKWKKMLTIAAAQGAYGIMVKAITQSDQPSLDVAKGVLALAGHPTLPSEQACGHEGVKDGRNISICPMSYLPFNSRARAIVAGEMHSIDTSITTLQCLSLIASNASMIMAEGPQTGHMVALGQFLRNKGQHIDFVKLDKWLARLGLQRMANLQGSILESCFGFEASELPFMHRSYAGAGRIMRHTLRDIRIKPKHVSELSAEYLGTNSQHSLHITRCLRFYRYMPAEAFCRFFANIFNKLSQIEE